MNNVYIPAQVVVIFRRIFNVISGISISNHHLVKQAKESTQDRDRKRSSSSRVWPFDGLWRKQICHFNDESTKQLLLMSAAIESVPSSDGNASSPIPDFENEASSPSSPEPQAPKNSCSQPNAIGPGHEPQDIIHKLLSSPVLYDPLRAPRHPIVLCHGLYGFDTRGPSSFPSMRMHYWSNVLSILRGKLGAEVIITSVPGTGSISSRAEHLDRQLREKARGRGMNFMAHSMGGLDCRHLIAHCKPEEYKPLSLTTISTPHRGSPFMDWCSENFGLGKLATEGKDLLARASKEETMSEKEKRDNFSSLSLSSLPSSFTTLLMSVLDSPAYANLTSTYLQDVFNPATPDNPNVKYFSVAGRMPTVNVWHPFWLPKMVLDDVEQKTRQRLEVEWERNNPNGSERERPLWARQEEWGNDGLVTIQSAKWGEFLGVMEGCDHWELRGARGIEFGVDLPAIPAIGLGPPSVADENGGQNFESSDERTSKDWGWFLKAWRKEEAIQQEAASKAKASRSPSSSEDRKREREVRRKEDEAVIKASTDKLSVVFDWLTERVPAPLPLLGGKRSSGLKDETQAFQNKEYSSQLDAKEGRKGKRNELATKTDLERFYVALSRKLYDEGL
ncbi:hypothetical protein E1B28_012785 [Marasmius oreades]|uniref:Alpha/beta-hydrolase n=1 Tax=Marasmius oreades TaxID=181124 RepID=A0A9P7RSE1_9AGAR|nr:uncharacterized protein E1B28_012785 [Marasmius oreades]KAG7088830.1 hypothetical protein E1B28_012785 [Marasmius oreades]